jgi:hypothetical protein
MFCTHEFWFKTFEKTLPDLPDSDAEQKVENARRPYDIGI